MRIVKIIPNDRFKIQLFNYNGKYILKIELGQFEQTFKINETDVFDVEEIEKIITQEFLKNTFYRFLQMREDWNNAFKK
jgi:hypothetical protein